MTVQHVFRLQGEMRAVQTTGPTTDSNCPETGEASRAHSPHVRAKCPLGKGDMGPVQVTGESEGLTLRGNKCKVLQHHIKVQASLSLSKEAPLLLGEVQSDILKGYTMLSGLEQIKP